jgi:hypothetical protein
LPTGRCSWQEKSRTLVRYDATWGIKFLERCKVFCVFVWEGLLNANVKKRNMCNVIFLEILNNISL